MDETSLCRVEELVQWAADLQPEQRPAYIEAHYGADPNVRAEVERLLSHLDKRAVASLAAVNRLDETEAESVGKHVCPYKLLALIGEGGFGRIYMAEQQKPIRRRVALKIIKLGMDPKQVVPRFEAERQALTLLIHESQHRRTARFTRLPAARPGLLRMIHVLPRSPTLVRYRGHSAKGSRGEYWYRSGTDHEEPGQCADHSK